MTKHSESRQEAPVHPTRLAILNASIALFGEHGYDGASYKDIGAAIGRPASIVSYHFGTKDNLYLETFRHLFRIYPFEATPWQGDGDSPALQSTEEAIACLTSQLERLIRELIPDSRMQDQLRALAAKLWTREIFEPRESLHGLFSVQLSPFVANFRSSIHYLRPELTPPEVDSLGVALVGQVGCQVLMRGLNKVIWGNDCLAVSPERTTELIVGCCLGGILQPVREPASLEPVFK